MSKKSGPHEMAGNHVKDIKRRTRHRFQYADMFRSNGRQERYVLGWKRPDPSVGHDLA